ncbi:hypothetical protein [Gordonia sp. CPCC 205333]|uniref:hypothetical protein n=1 Tax=Gordonia sp. CPCC 205333 TaxID=3140790 RepID=UPI003AF3488E
MTQLVHQQIDDLVQRAARLLGGRSGPSAAPGTRILFADGGDGSTATELAAACRRLDTALDVAVGGADDIGEVMTVVVVVDAGCDNSGAMRTPMTRLLRSVGRVALVCNKIDAFWRWPQMLADYRERLDPYHLCPLFAVAVDAPGDPTSGVEELVDWLHTQSATSGGDTYLRSRATATVAALSAVVADYADTGDAQAVALRRRRAALVADRDRGRADRLAGMRVGLIACRGSTAGRAQSRLRALSAQALARTETLSTQQDARGVGDWLTGEVSRCELTEIAGLRASTARLTAVALLGIDTRQRRVLPVLGPAASGRALPAVRRGADDALVMVFGASTGLGSGRLVATQLVDAGLAGWASMTATVVVGLAMALWVVRTRRQGALRAAMRSWVADTCADARTRIEQAIFVITNDVEPMVVAAISRHYEREGRRAAQAVAEIDGRLRSLRHRAEAASEAVALGREIAGCLARQ